VLPKLANTSSNSIIRETMIDIQGSTGSLSAFSSYDVLLQFESSEGREKERKREREKERERETETEKDE